MQRASLIITFKWTHDISSFVLLAHKQSSAVQLYEQLLNQLNEVTFVFILQRYNNYFKLPKAQSYP